MKRVIHTMAAIIAGIMLLQINVSATAFKDVGASKPYVSAVGFVSNAGLMVGYGDGTFRPDNPVTRAEMATVLCKLLKQDANLKKDGKKFSDVPTSHWGNAYVCKAASLGVLSGYGNGKFGPDDIVTYEQALTMMVNAMNFGSAAGKLGGYPNGYVKVADNLGLTANVSGKAGTKLTRGNVAIMLFNYYDNSQPIANYLGKSIDSLIADFGYDYAQEGYAGSDGRSYKSIAAQFLYFSYEPKQQIHYVCCFGDRNYYKGLSAQMTYPELAAILPSSVKLGKPEGFYMEMDDEYEYSVSFDMDGYHFSYKWLADPTKNESVELQISFVD